MLLLLTRLLRMLLSLSLSLLQLLMQLLMLPKPVMGSEPIHKRVPPNRPSPLLLLKQQGCQG